VVFRNSQLSVFVLLSLPQKNAPSGLRVPSRRTGEPWRVQLATTAGYAASPSSLSTRRSTSAMSGAELNEARQVAQYEYVIYIVAMTQSLL
jgi:hypothetical protein